MGWKPCPEDRPRQPPWMRTLVAPAVLVAALQAWLPASVVAQALPPSTSPETWARVWDAERQARPVAPLWTHAYLEQEVHRVVDTSGGLFAMESIGLSLEGRRLHHVTAGRGPFPVLLWSQMHGDEPSATPALFDLLDYVARHRDEPLVRHLLDRLTLHIVPMLNPDGAQRFERRNAQGIDINRDALRLQTPEGVALKALRDRVSARLGFNLHNQGWRTSVGTPPRPASISLLAVAFDDARTEDEGRRLTKRVCAVIRGALEPFAAGQIGRYDDSFEVRAFGDNVTKWGTPVVLIETGPWAGPDPELALTRLNFIALMAALEAVATAHVDRADPADYESLPINDDRLFHTLIVNATIAPATGVPPFTGDIGITANRVVRDAPEGRRLTMVGRIEDLGDLRVHGALETIDATGKWVAPLPADGAAVGAEVELPGTRDRRQGPVILPGQPAALMILTPAGPPGRFRVERVISFDDPRR